MKVIAFNGSPRKEGNTYQALKLVCDELEKEAIETEIIQVGSQDIRGCMGCNQCFKKRDGKCVIKTDYVSHWIEKMKQADGILLGSPVHYSAVAANMKAFLDRAFYVAGANDSMFRHKVGASVVAVRRSGGLPTFNELNHYLNYSEMILATSNYWNVIHGTRPGDIHQDEEGVQIMRVLGKNMAWILKLVENGKGKIAAPELEAKKYTNFVR